MGLLGHDGSLGGVSIELPLCIVLLRPRGIPGIIVGCAGAGWVGGIGAGAGGGGAGGGALWDEHIGQCISLPKLSHGTDGAGGPGGPGSAFSSIGGG
jgi:hypothetical protein